MLDSTLHLKRPVQRRSALNSVGRSTCPVPEEDQMPDDESTPAPAPQTEPVEPRGVRLRRHAHRTNLYAWAFVVVALLVVVIALAAANTGQVKLSWVVGTSHASLVWIVVVACVLGWLLGLATGIVFRLRTRRRPTGEGS
jgi:uncharacterized integral membrane protein